MNSLEARLETVRHVVGYVCRVFVIGRPVDVSRPLHVYCTHWRQTAELATEQARAWAEDKGLSLVTDSTANP